MMAFHWCFIITMLTLMLVLFCRYEFVYLIDCVSEDGISLLFCDHNLDIGMECFTFIIYQSDSFEIRIIVPLCIDLMCFIKYRVFV